MDLISTADIMAVRSKMLDLPDALARYAYLSRVKADKPGLFYAALQRLPQDFLPVVYTPGVGDACRSWGALAARPSGLTVSIASDAGRVAPKLRAFVKDRDIQAIVVTDGAPARSAICHLTDRSVSPLQARRLPFELGIA